MRKINSLINISNNDGVLVTESREVALNFGKLHKNIIRDIENVIKNKPAQNWARYFIPHEYRDKKGEIRKQYLLTRDGFSLLVMGFTGQKALEWKLKYIEAFNRMEETIKNQRFTVDPELLQCIKEANKLIPFVQDKDLRDIIARQALSKLYNIDIPQLNVDDRTAYCDEAIKNFIHTQCEVKKGLTVKIAVLYTAYLNWCEINEVHSLTKIGFGKNIKRLGIKQGKSGKFRYWKGISLKDWRR